MGKLRMSPLNNAKSNKLETSVSIDSNKSDIKTQKLTSVILTELEMQRRALVSLKQQRDLDRKRRLQWIIRTKRQQDSQDKFNFKCKLVLSVSLLLSIVSLIIKI